MLIHKWKVFWAIAICGLLGTFALAYISFISEPPTGSTVVIETVKALFLGLGGLGVILPIFLNAVNSIEDRESRKIEATYDLLSKWDAPELLEARRFTRKIKEEHSGTTDEDLVNKITYNDDLKQSVLLIFNYCEQARFSIESGRIAQEQYKEMIGPILLDIINRFEPYYRNWGDQHLNDIEKLKKLLTD